MVWDTGLNINYKLDSNRIERYRPSVQEHTVGLNGRLPHVYIVDIQTYGRHGRKTDFADASSVVSVISQPALERCWPSTRHYQHAVAVYDYT